MADVFSLDKLSIKKLKALAGRNNVSLRGCFEKSDIIKTLRDAGVKEHSGPPPASSSSNEATPRHAQQYNATVPGQAYTSAYSSPMPSARKPRSKEADLQALSISQLKRVARERRIDTSHCFEKADLIAALRPPPLPPPTASLLPCVRVLPRVRPAPPTGAPAPAAEAGGDTVRFRLAAVVAGGALWLEELGDAPLAREQVALVRAMVRACGWAAAPRFLPAAGGGGAAAAKVRRAQDAVIAGRPFAENLVQVLYGVNQRIRGENVDSPLAEVRPVTKVALVVCTGDRGLCGGFNNFVIKKAEQRHAELLEAGIGVEMVLVGKKGIQYFNRRSDQYDIVKTFEVGQNITIKESQAIADTLFSSFTTLGVDKVEMIYTKFKSLIASDAIVQTLLPMSKEGEVCDVDGNCLDPLEDELFNLTSKDGEFAVSREKVETEVSSFDDLVIFEQEPEQILDALLPLYMNSQVLRALQESLASELAASCAAKQDAAARRRGAALASIKDKALARARAVEAAKFRKTQTLYTQVNQPPADPEDAWEIVDSPAE